MQVSQLSLEPDPEREYLVCREYFEPVDISRFKALLQCDEKVLKRVVDLNQCVERPEWALWFPTQRAQITKLIENERDGDVVVRYQFSKKNRNVYGRVSPIHGASAGEVAGKLRSFLLFGLWTALDIANCHPSIMCQVMQQHSVPCENLS